MSALLAAAKGLAKAVPLPPRSRWTFPAPTATEAAAAATVSAPPAPPPPTTTPPPPPPPPLPTAVPVLPPTASTPLPSNRGHFAPPDLHLLPARPQEVCGALFVARCRHIYGYLDRRRLNRFCSKKGLCFWGGIQPWLSPTRFTLHAGCVRNAVLREIEVWVGAGWVTLEVFIKDDQYWVSEPGHSRRHKQ